MAEYDRVITGPTIDGYGVMVPQASIYASLPRWHETPGDAVYALSEFVFELNGALAPGERFSISLHERDVVSVMYASGKKMASSTIFASSSNIFAFGDSAEEFWEFVSQIVGACVILSGRSVAFVRGSQGQVNVDFVKCKEKERK